MILMTDPGDRFKLPGFDGGVRRFFYILDMRIFSVIVNMEKFKAAL